MLKPLARDTLTQQATDTLRKFVLCDQLTVGDQLPSERELSEILSVSRNIVREALSVLVAEGLIVKKAGRGIFVADYDPALVNRHMLDSSDRNGHDLAVLSEARAAIELGAVDLITRRITPGQLQRLREINGALAQKLHAKRSAVKDDVEFHKVLLQSTHNAVLVEMIPLLVEHFRLMILYRPAVILNNPDRIVTEHQQIIDALASGDPTAVRAALVTHLNRPIVS